MKKHFAAITLSAATILACSADPDADSPSATQGDESTIGCPQLTLDECARNTNCRTIQGHRVNSTEQCLESQSAAACTAVSASTCTNTITWAREPAGNLWQFSDSCIPAGWTPDNPTDAVADTCDPMPETPCDGLTEAECICARLAESECFSSDVCKPVLAWKVDSTKSCIEEEQQFCGCILPPLFVDHQICANALSLHQSPSGNLCVFPCTYSSPPTNGWTSEPYPSEYEWGCTSLGDSSSTEFR